MRSFWEWFLVVIMLGTISYLTRIRLHYYNILIYLGLSYTIIVLTMLGFFWINKNNRQSSDQDKEE